VTYSKSGQNKKEANKQTAFIPVHSLVATHRITKNSLMLVNIHLTKRKCVSFHTPPMARQRDTITDAPHSVGLLWTSDQLDAETSTWHHTTLTKDRYPCPQRDSCPKSQQARGCRHTPYTAWPQGSAEMRQNGKKGV
jgi:hypothetical protein